MKENWVEEEPTELRYVAYPDKGKPDMRPGDLLVYYAAVHQRIFGIVEVFMPPTKDNSEPRWPWRCEVRPKLIISHLNRAPHLDCLATEGGKDYHKSVMRLSHMTLDDDEFQRARNALEAAFDESQGDIRDRWFNREY